MSIAGGIRAGLAFVEIKSHDTEFQASMLRMQQRMVEVGAQMRRLGTYAGVFAGALSAPMIGGLRAAQAFDDSLRGLQASVSDLSPEQLKAVRDESLRLARSLGVAPEKIADQFLNLAKAGMSVEAALGGAAKTAVMFAKVGGLEGGQAAELLADAMNVFGTSAEQAAGSISAAANASSVDINQMTQAFSMAGAVAGMAGQNIDDTSAALAILGKNMLKGSDAGTSLKTLLLRLTAPTGEAKNAMQDLGLTARAFTDAAGKPIRLPAMIDVLNAKLGKMNDIARRDVLTRLFGADAIRSAQILTQTGSKGFEQMLGAMNEAVPLGQQFEYLMAGVTGFFSALETGAKLLSIAFQTSLGPSLQYAGKAFLFVADKVSWLLENVPGLGPALAGVAVAAIGLALALLATAGATALTNVFMAQMPLKVTTALAWAASVAFGAVSKAAMGMAAAIYAIPGIGWIAGIITALGALGAAAYYFSSGPSKPKGAAKKGRPQIEMGAALGAGLPSPEAFQGAFVAAGAPGGGAAARPVMNSGEQGALSMQRVERLLTELVDISKGQRPAWT